MIAIHAGHCLPVWYSIRATPLQFACFLNQICLCCSLLTCHTRHNFSCGSQRFYYHPAPKRDATVQYNVWEPLKIQFVPMCSNGNVCMFNFWCDCNVQLLHYMLYVVSLSLIGLDEAWCLKSSSGLLGFLHLSFDKVEQSDASSEERVSIARLGCKACQDVYFLASKHI